MKDDTSEMVDAIFSSLDDTNKDNILEEASSKYADMVVNGISMERHNLIIDTLAKINMSPAELDIFNSDMIYYILADKLDFDINPYVEKLSKAFDDLLIEIFKKEFVKKGKHNAPMSPVQLLTLVTSIALTREREDEVGDMDIEIAKVKREFKDK